MMTKAQQSYKKLQIWRKYRCYFSQIVQIFGPCTQQIGVGIAVEMFTSWWNSFACSESISKCYGQGGLFWQCNRYSQCPVINSLQLRWSCLEAGSFKLLLGLWQSYWVHHEMRSGYDDGIDGIHIHSVVPFYISMRCYWSNNKWQSNRKQQFTGMLRIPKCAWCTACAAPTPLINWICKIPALL